MKNKISILFALMILSCNVMKAQAQQVSDKNLVLHYTFEQTDKNTGLIVDQSTNNFKGKLQNKASVKNIDGYHVLDLGESNGYVEIDASVGELISKLDDFSVTLNIFIDESVDLEVNGSFIWSFANSDDIGREQNGIIFYSAKNDRYSISKTYYPQAQDVQNGPPAKKGIWQHITYTQKGNIGTIYINGRMVKSGKVDLLPKDIGKTTFNFLGKSPYQGDAYMLKSKIHDFRIYNKALGENDIEPLLTPFQKLNALLAEQQLHEAIQNINIPNADKINKNIELPAKLGNDIAVQWESSHPDIINNVGKVNRPSIGNKGATVSLKATLMKNNLVKTKTIEVTVLPAFSDKKSVETDAANITLSDNIQNLRSHLNLPVHSMEGSKITWKSKNTETINNKGEIVKRPEHGKGKQKVVVTAIVSKGKESMEKDFDIFVAEDEGYSAYLFTYFTGNGPGEEAVRYALSYDGYNYRALNNNKAIMASDKISTSGGVRDPHILRGADGKFYMVITDLYVPEMGWQNYAMILMKSDDLIHWTHSIINIPETYPAEFGNVNRVWAPQTNYDEKTGKYMIYWSMRKDQQADIIYYAYANANFTGLENVPQQLFFHPEGKACIDGDIIYKDGMYNLFFKTEGSGAGIKKAVSSSIHKDYKMIDRYLDQTDAAVEGSGVFRLINSDKYILMYDVYTSGRYEFTESYDLENFKVIDHEISMNFHPRHGTVIPITSEEAGKLAEIWATENDLTLFSSASNDVKTRNVAIDEKNSSVYLPLHRSANLQKLDPEFNILPGAVISPMGPQDFSKGPVKYTVRLKNKTGKTFTVSASVDHNPVLNGYYADPEIMYAEKTGKYYLVPTSDGFTGWSGNYFEIFSSDNLVDWKNEGKILDLPSQVSWTSRNAWAPAIIEKKINGEYTYFYYFTAAQKVGVAVANHPTGPYVDKGEPIIGTKPAGINRGQEIDPDVFEDPVSGKTYLYWGNGYMAVVELTDDMLNYKENSLQIIKTDGTFREGTEVFYRNGTYYFMWSEDDTRSENYRVRYATSKSPLGPLNIPENNLVIAKDTAHQIYATGHNCVLNIPGTDEWYIIYHRFTRPKGIDMGRAAGYNREVCIDKMEFNKDGSIKRVTPTLKGIEPINK